MAARIWASSRSFSSIAVKNGTLSVASCFIILSPLSTRAASKFAPLSTAFVLQGGITVKTPNFNKINCQYLMNGSTDDEGKIVIKSVKICDGVIATRLPWMWTAKSSMNSTGLAEMSYYIDGVDCGFLIYKIIDSRNGLLFFNKTEDGCTIGEGGGSFAPKIYVTK